MEKIKIFTNKDACILENGINGWLTHERKKEGGELEIIQLLQNTVYIDQCKEPFITITILYKTTQ